MLLRDLRPLLEFAGEFATKLTMSLYYNNNLMGLRAGSRIGRQMLEDVAATPDPTDSATYCTYVTKLGGPCYPKWTWNHGLIQLAVQRGTGIVAYPTHVSDPACVVPHPCRRPIPGPTPGSRRYACFPSNFVAASGGLADHRYTIDETLELIRGAFVLHSRAYNAKKPLNSNSGFAKLYARAATLAAANRPEPTPIVKIAPRDPEEKAAYVELLNRRGQDANLVRATACPSPSALALLNPTPRKVDPAFIPAGPRHFVLLEAAEPRFKNLCLDAERNLPGQSFGGHPELRAAGDCAAALKQRMKVGKTSVQTVFIWHPLDGYVRPAHAEPGKVQQAPTPCRSVVQPLTRRRFSASMHFQSAPRAFRERSTACQMVGGEPSHAPACRRLTALRPLEHGAAAARVQQGSAVAALDLRRAPAAAAKPLPRDVHRSGPDRRSRCPPVRRRARGRAAYAHHRRGRDEVWQNTDPGTRCGSAPLRWVGAPANYDAAIPRR